MSTLGAETDMRVIADLKRLDASILKRLAILGWSAVFIGSLCALSVYAWDSLERSRLHEQLRTGYYADAAAPVQEAAPSDNAHVLPGFTSLLALNKEMAGWLSIPGTPIDYPVVRAKDNEYYLTHNAKMEPSAAGAIFMDYRNSGTHADKNTVLYGHSMKDGTMFMELLNYKDKDYFERHGTVGFHLLNEEGLWRIFSVYVTAPGFNYIETNFAAESDYERFLAAIKGKSMFANEVEVTGDDHILTLSTCSYEFDDARFVVHAKRIDRKPGV